MPSAFIADGNGEPPFSYSHPDFRIRIPGSAGLAAAKAIAKPKQIEHP